MAVAQPGMEGRPAERTRTWAGDRLEPFAPLAGVVAVVLLAVATVIGDGTNAPENEAPAQAYVQYFTEETDAIFVSTLALGLGLLFFLWFAAALRARLAVAEGSPHRLSNLTLVAAGAWAVMLGAAVAPTLSGAILADEDAPFSGEVAQTLYWVGDGFWAFSLFMLGLWLLAVGAAVLRTGTLPRWLGWVTLAMGVLAPIWFVGWAIMFFVLPVWILLVAVLLYRAPRAAV